MLLQGGRLKERERYTFRMSFCCNVRLDDDNLAPKYFTLFATTNRKLPTGCFVMNEFIPFLETRREISIFVIVSRIVLVSWCEKHKVTQKLSINLKVEKFFR